MIAPTLMGRVSGVSGASLKIDLLPTVASGFAIISGQSYRVGQVGTFIRVPQGYQDLYGYVTEVVSSPVPDKQDAAIETLGKVLQVQLVGEVIGNRFERGISQYPNVNDEAHIVTEQNLETIYRNASLSQIPVGTLSSSENISVTVDVNSLINKHSAVVGSTGAGKSTTVASLLRSIISGNGTQTQFPGARVVLIDIHGEYGSALKDVAKVYRINADIESGEHELCVPYWALPISDLIKLIGGSYSEKQIIELENTILRLKKDRLSKTGHEITSITENALTVDAPIPFSLKKLWYRLIDIELKTFLDNGQQNPARESEGDAATLTQPQYRAIGPSGAAPFLNKSKLGIQRQLNSLRSRLLDKRYDFILRPQGWEPNESGIAEKDLPELLSGWIGHDKQVTIFDLSGVPSEFLSVIIGKITSTIYDAMFWGRKLDEGAKNRPILFVLEEAHRYLGSDSEGDAKYIIQRIVKEGRKYGMGAMIVSQRPVEVDDTILSQCGTFFTLRLSNPSDRGKVKGALPDAMSGLTEMLPVLRTGECLIIGEAAKLPVRCRIRLPKLEHRPDSGDPNVTEAWEKEPPNCDYKQVVANWRAKDAKFSAGIEEN